MPPGKKKQAHVVELLSDDDEDGSAPGPGPGPGPKAEGKKKRRGEGSAPGAGPKAEAEAEAKKQKEQAPIPHVVELLNDDDESCLNPKPTGGKQKARVEGDGVQATGAEKETPRAGQKWILRQQSSRGDSKLTIRHWPSEGEHFYASTARALRKIVSISKLQFTNLYERDRTDEKTEYAVRWPIWVQKYDLDTTADPGWESPGGELNGMSLAEVYDEDTKSKTYAELVGELNALHDEKTRFSDEFRASDGGSTSTELKERLKKLVVKIASYEQRISQFEESFVDQYEQKRSVELEQVRKVFNEEFERVERLFARSKIRDVDREIPIGELVDSTRSRLRSASRDDILFVVLLAEQQQLMYVQEGGTTVAWCRHLPGW